MNKLKGAADVAWIWGGWENKLLDRKSKAALFHDKSKLLPWFCSVGWPPLEELLYPSTPPCLLGFTVPYRLAVASSGIGLWEDKHCPDARSCGKVLLVSRSKDTDAQLESRAAHILPLWFTKKNKQEICWYSRVRLSEKIWCLLYCLYFHNHFSNTIYMDICSQKVVESS